MSPRWILNVIAALSIGTPPAHANILTDLPNPADEMDAGQFTAAREFRAGLSISNISRRTDGEVHRIELARAQKISGINIKVTESRLKIHEALLRTESGQSIPISRLQSSEALQTGRTLSSGKLQTEAPISYIELRLESFQREATVTVEVLSENSAPELNSRRFPTPEPVTPQEQDRKDASALKAGDRVLSINTDNTGGYAGTILEIYSNGKASIRDDDDGKTYVRDLNRVGKRISCDQKFKICEKDKVLSQTTRGNSYFSQVVAVYSNGYAFVRDDDDGQMFLRKASLMSKSVKCGPLNICQGDRVLSGGSNYYPGTVVTTYSNGISAVRDDDDGKVYARKNEAIFKSVRCLPDRANLCIDAKVLSKGSSQHYTGTVVGIYSNGLIYIRDNDDQKAYPRRQQNVSVEVQCSQRGNFCTGQRVLSQTTKAYYPGQITHVYDNDLAAIRDDDDGRIYIRHLNQLSKVR